MATGSLTFTADSDKTVTVSGADVSVTNDSTSTADVFLNSTTLAPGASRTFNAGSSITVKSESIQQPITGNIGTIPELVTLLIDGEEVQPNSSKQFTSNFTVSASVEETQYKITLPVFPPNLRVFFNGVEVFSEEVVTIEDNIAITFELASVLPVEIPVTYSNMETVTYNGTSYPTPDGSFTIEAAESPTEGLTMVGADNVPDIIVNGTDIQALTINQTAYAPTDLPVTFTPDPNITNQIFVEGSVITPMPVTIAGTGIASATANNEPIKLPYTFTPDEATVIAVSAEVYTVDIDSPGGAIISRNGVMLSDGTSAYHEAIDVTANVLYTVDGEHTMTVDGADIKQIVFNGIVLDGTDLPRELKTRAMTSTLDVVGYAPSTLNLSGLYMEDLRVNSVTIPIVDGSVNYTMETREDVINVIMAGTQPRPQDTYEITWNTNNATTIYYNGNEVPNGSTTIIDRDGFVEARALPIPVHFDVTDGMTTTVNGRVYTGSDFTIQVDQETFVTVEYLTCELTVGWAGVDQYTITLPQDVVYITAPQVDWKKFNTWTSTVKGIGNARSVKTTLDLRNTTTATVQAHYVAHPGWCDLPKDFT